jgi:predicted RNA-binding Zn-ribbon protein involved in translation (DUF1610 family)
MEKTKYTKDDVKCPHCGGFISAHCAGVNIIYWCDDCGSNNPQTPPNVTLEFTN